jgi:hypothetical protein
MLKMSNLTIDEAIKIAANPFANRDDLINAINLRSAIVNTIAAHNRNTDSELQTMIIAMGHIEATIAVATSPHASSMTLTRLAQSDYVFVRAAVASNQKSPSVVLGYLINDNEIVVRLAAAANVALSEDLLSRLSDEDDDLINLWIARNIGASGDVLDKIVDYKNILVCWEIMKNPNTRTDTMEMIIRNGPIEVAAAFSKSFDIDADLKALAIKRILKSDSRPVDDLTIAGMSGDNLMFAIVIKLLQDARNTGSIVGEDNLIAMAFKGQESKLPSFYKSDVWRAWKDKQNEED